MHVLSLCDGISCGRVALGRAGIQVENYFASEIDKYALKVAQSNYTQVGGVSNTQRYKMLGNGWVVDVIAHIFSFIRKEGAI